MAREPQRYVVLPRERRLEGYALDGDLKQPGWELDSDTRAARTPDDTVDGPFQEGVLVGRHTSVFGDRAAVSRRHWEPAERTRGRPLGPCMQNTTKKGRQRFWTSSCQGLGCGTSVFTGAMMTHVSRILATIAVSVPLGLVGCGDNTGGETSSCPLLGQTDDHGTGTVQFVRDGQQHSYTADGGEDAAVKGSVEDFRLMIARNDSGDFAPLDLLFLQDQNGEYRLTSTGNLDQSEPFELTVEGERVYGEFAGELQDSNGNVVESYSDGTVDVVPRCWTWPKD